MSIKIRNNAVEKLKKLGYLVILWHIEDVIGYAKDLKYPDGSITAEEAQDILDSIQRSYDPVNGVSWLTLDYYIRELMDKKGIQQLKDPADDNPPADVMEWLDKPENRTPQEALKLLKEGACIMVEVSTAEFPLNPRDEGEDSDTCFIGKYIDDFDFHSDEQILKRLSEYGALQHWGEAKEFTVEDYLQRHKESGLSLNDTVTVVRMADSFEQGWQDGWNTQMNANIGKTGTIVTDNGVGGFGVSIDRTTFYYPFFILKKG